MLRGCYNTPCCLVRDAQCSESHPYGTCGMLIPAGTMATRIQVEIEHRRYVDLCVARRGEHGQLSITTIEPGQQRAVIKLFAVRGEKRTPLQTIDVRQLPSDTDRYIPMQLTSAVVPGGRLRVRLYVEGALFLERFVPVGRFLGVSKVLVIALLVLILLGLAVAVTAGLLAFREPAEPEVTETHSDEPAVVADPTDDPPPGEPDKPAEPDEPAEPAEPELDEDPVALRDPDPVDTPDEPDDEMVEPGIYVVRFNPESAMLRTDTQRRLDEVAATVGEHDLLLRIDGHTAIAGTEEGRRRLSERRAKNVRDYLVEAGVPADRITELRALGASDPLTEDRDLQDENRRVEIVEMKD